MLGDDLGGLKAACSEYRTVSHRPAWRQLIAPVRSWDLFLPRRVFNDDNDGTMLGVHREGRLSHTQGFTAFSGGC